MRVFLLPVAFSLLALAACEEAPPEVTSARAPLAERLHLQRMLVLERPPVIALQDPREMPLAVRAAGRADAEELERRPVARWVGTDALPFLTQTRAGLDFLAAQAPRALARGMPAEFCPALEVAHGAEGASEEAARQEVARRALTGCLAQLDPGHEGCGCRVIALDDVVTVPRDETAYATGVSARLRVAPLDIDVVLVAEDGPGKETLLRDLAGPVARLTHGAEDRVAVAFERGRLAGHRFEGRRIPVGFRRGRLAERIYATDAEGNRLSLLVGFEPDELAGQAAAWLAWPSPWPPRG